MECGVWLKIAAHIGLMVPVSCHDEFSMHQISIFLVINGKLHNLSTSKYKFFFTFWSHGACLWCTILSCFKKVMSFFFCLELGAPAWVVVIMFSIVMIIVWFQFHECTPLFYQHFLNKLLFAFVQLSESVAADIWCFFCFVKDIQIAPIFYGCVLPS